MKKYVKISIFVIMEFLIVIVCVLFGKYLNSAAQKPRMLTIEKIALVNLDEGVKAGDSIKNYGVEFIGSLDGDYEVTGLEQARTGMENGLYAAYIIIPAAFSRNIESINSEPVKSNIVYRINHSLEAATREKVITDITSYCYFFLVYRVSKKVVFDSACLLLNIFTAKSSCINFLAKADKIQRSKRAQGKGEDRICRRYIRMQ